MSLDGNPDAIRVDSFAVTFDATQSAELEQAQPSNSTLRDLVSGNEYRLRRIVGKYFATWLRNPEGTEANSPPLIDVAAGFIVCRTDDDGVPTTDFEQVNPLVQDSAEDPWIWRRRWFLRTIVPPGTTNEFQAGATFPGSTAGYGSVADGPHIDQKTARRIARQERLFFVQAARVYDIGGSVTEFTLPGSVCTYLDYRILGSLISGSKGNRRNASR